MELLYAPRFATLSSRSISIYSVALAGAMTRLPKHNIRVDTLEQHESVLGKWSVVAVVQRYAKRLVYAGGRPHWKFRFDDPHLAKIHKNEVNICDKALTRSEARTPERTPLAGPQ